MLNYNIRYTNCNHKGRCYFFGKLTEKLKIGILALGKNCDKSAGKPSNAGCGMKASKLR